MPPLNSVTVTAPAKVNLFLHVTGRRDDGYHLLESLFVFTRTGDRLTLAPAAGLQFYLEGPFAERLKALGGDGDSNLVVRAARALALAAGRAADVAITLEKNLPVEGGIGGGSADAAAVLLGLNKLWGLNWPLERLAEIALPLGADVPACLHGRPVFVRGIGEVIEPVHLPWRGALLLVNAGRGSPTPHIFKAYRESGMGFDAPLPTPETVWQSPEVLARLTRNSLQAAASAANDSVSSALGALAGLEGVQMVRMSGSGSTCFALFASLADSEAAARRLKAAHPDWWVMADEITVPA